MKFFKICISVPLSKNITPLLISFFYTFIKKKEKRKTDLRMNIIFQQYPSLKLLIFCSLLNFHYKLRSPYVPIFEVVFMLLTVWKVSVFGVFVKSVRILSHSDWLNIFWFFRLSKSWKTVWNRIGNIETGNPKVWWVWKYEIFESMRTSVI